MSDIPADSAPKRTKVSQIQVLEASTTAPSVNKMLDNSLTIIDEQIEKFRLRSKFSTLDEKESRTLLGYVKSLVEISKEEREREKSDKGTKELANLSTEELLARAALLTKGPK